MMRAGVPGVRVPAWLVLACLALTGCRHKPQPAAPLAVPPAVASLPVDHPQQKGVIAPVPVTPAPTTSAKVPPKKVPKPRKKAVPAAAVPVQVASAGPVPASENVIGALSAGGTDARQRAAELIAEMESRMKSLPSETVKSQPEQVARMKNFLGDARKALKGGDADAAVTLATKAKVLLDDLAK